MVANFNRPCGTFDTSVAQTMAIVRTPLQWVLLVLFLIFLFASPLFMSGRLLSLANLIGISIVSIQGLHVITGLCGQMNLGQTAFMAVGAYSSALLVSRVGLPWLLALPCAAIISGIVALMFGLPSLRIKGFYLAMATLAAQFIIPTCIVNIRPDITGGTHSLIVNPPIIAGFSFDSQGKIFYPIMIIAILITYFTKNIARTGVGRAFVAIRDNDLSAEVMGVNTFYYKLLAFFICGLFAGVAGTLWGSWMRAINPDNFTLMGSIWYIGMLIIGGLGSTAGAIFGVIFLRLIDFFASDLSLVLGDYFPQYMAFFQGAFSNLIQGLTIVLFVVLEPRGLNERWQNFKSSYRLHPFNY